MKFRPCIDIHNGKVKQIVGGTLTDDNHHVVENFVADKDSDYYARLFKKDGLTGGHVIMLGPGNEEQAKMALKAYPGGLQVGGGITAENAESYLMMGASHVIVTSYVFRDGDIHMSNLDKLLAEAGRKKLVLDLSCRKKDDRFYVVTDRWQKFTRYEINRKNIQELSEYCDEFLIHAADVEGMCRGIQTELAEILGDCVDIPATYAGGVRSLEDAALVRQLGRNRLDVTIGSALDIFGGKLSYQSVNEWFAKNN